MFFLPRTSLRKCALYQTSDPNDKLIARTMPVVPSLVKTMAAPKSTCKENAKSVFEIGGGSGQSMLDWRFLAKRAFSDHVDIYVVSKTSGSLLKTRRVWEMYYINLIDLLEEHHGKTASLKKILGRVGHLRNTTKLLD